MRARPLILRRRLLDYLNDVLEIADAFDASWFCFSKLVWQIPLSRRVFFDRGRSRLETRWWAQPRVFDRTKAAPEFRCQPRVDER